MAGSDQLGMDLLPEDDDLLSYFLSPNVPVMAPSQRGMPPSTSAPVPPVPPSSLGLGPNVPLNISGSSSGSNAAAFSSFAPEVSTFQFSAGAGLTDSSAAGSTVTPLQQMQAQLSGPGAPSAGSLSSTDNRTTSARSPGGNKFSSTSRSSSSELTANSNSQTPGSSSSGAGMDTDEKRQRRLARNRESARQSRRRKKQYLELLEEKVSQISEEIETLRRSHLEAADGDLAQLKRQLIKTIHEKYQTIPEEKKDSKFAQEMNNGRKMLQQRFGPNCDERRAVIEYNFQQLENLLLPPYTRFLLWLSVQDDEFFGPSDASNAKKEQSFDSPSNPPPSTNKKGLWSILSSDWNLTYEQEEKIKQLYSTHETKVYKAERRRIAMAMTYLTCLKNSMATRTASVQKHSDKLHNILTPVQSLKFLNRVENNRGRLNQCGLQKKHISGKEDDRVGSILQKDDHDLTVEDVTELLAALN